MSAIVAGQGLGLINTSLGQLGASGQLGQATQGRSGERVYVNAGTGNLVVQQQDEWLMGTGPDVALLRTYNSLGTSNDDNGDNWRLGLSRRVLGASGTINTAGSTVSRLGEDGAEQLFTYDAGRAAYVSKQGGGSYDTLAWDGSVWTFTDGDTQVREVYEVVNATTREARLKSVTDLDGKTLTLGYNAAGLVTEIKTAGGETVYIDYDSSAGKTANILQIRTVKADASVRTRVRYGYDSANRLTSVTVDLNPEDNSVADGKTYVTTYTYVDATSDRLDTLTQTDGSKLDFDYDASGRITAVKETVDGQVRTTSFDYSVAGVTKVTDALGQVTELAYDASTKLLRSIKAPMVGNGTQLPRFGYDANGDVYETIDARGNSTRYRYDGNGNRIYERDMLGNVVERSYGSRNELLSETVYRLPDPDGEGAALPGQGATTRYVYDAKLHLRFVVDADGRVTEHQYNSLGQRSATLRHGGGLYGNAAAAQPALAELEGWAAGLDKSKGQRSDFAYDTRGQLSKATTYSQLTAAGAGMLNGEQGVTQYVYDPAGQLLQTIDARGAVTTYKQDGLNRLVSQTDGLGRVTTTVYNDALRQTTVTMANGLVTVSTFDATGRVVKLEQLDGTQANASLGVATYQYDKLGRLVKTTDATGRSSYLIYDAASRKVGEVDAEGGLTEYLYTPENQVAATKRYGNAVSAAMLASLAADPAGAALPQSLLDNGMAGWRQGSEPASANVTSGQNLNATYSLPGDVTLWLKQTGTEPLTSYIESAAAKVVAGRRYEVSAYTGVQRAAGVSLEVFFYDKDGKRILPAAGDTSQVPTGGDLLNNAEKRAGATLATYKRLWGFVTAPTGADSARVVVRKTPTIEGEPYSFAFATHVHVGEVSATQVNATPINVRPAAHAHDRVSRNIYDKAGRLAKTIDATGSVVEYRYDGADRVVETVAYANRLTPAQLSALTALTTSAGLDIPPTSPSAVPVADAANDRRTRYFFSDAGLALGTLDAEGYLTRNIYDDAGRLSRTVRHATVTTEALRASGTLAELTPAADPANDTLTAYFHDAKGQVTGCFVAESYDSATALHRGYLSWARYDAAGNKIEEVREAIRVTYNEATPAVLPTVPTGAHSLDERTTFQYDAANRLVRQDKRESGQPLALVTLLEYDLAGNVVRTIRGAETAEARTQQKRYDVQGRLVAELGAEGHQQLLALGTGATAAQVDAVWQRWGTQHSYDKAGRRISTVTPNAATGGDKTVFYYDGEDRLTHSINALGEVTEYGYNAFGDRVRETRYAKTLAAPGAGGLNTAISAAVAALAGGETTRRTDIDQLGRVWAWYDAQGQVLSKQSYTAFGEAAQRYDQVQVRGAAATTLTSQLVYDRRGLLKSRTEATGTAAQRTTQLTHDAFGRVVESIDGRGGVVTRQYDRMGREIEVKDATGVARATTYDAFSRVYTSKDGWGFTTISTYDPAKGRLTVKTPEGVSTTTDYNQFGEVVSVSNGQYRTEYEYNRDGQLVATRKEVPATGAVMAEATARYDEAGRAFETRDARGTLTRTSYDPAGRVLTRVVDPDGLKLTTRYRYDAKGQASWVQDANGVWTLTEYDVHGRVAAVTTDPRRGPDAMVGAADDNPSGLGIRTEYAYDLGGRVVTLTEGAGSTQPKVTRYVYDELGRRVEEIVSPGVVNVRTVYTYDANDNVTVKTDANGAVTRYVYDAEDRLVWLVDGTGAVRNTGYDANGRISRTIAYADRIDAASLAALGLAATSEAVAAALAAANADYANNAGNQVEYRTYDKDGRLTHTVDALGFVVKREYDASGNVVKLTRFANVVQRRIGIYTNAATIPTSLLRVAPPVLVAVGATPPATGSYLVESPAADQVEQTFYDAAGRAAYSVDALNGVTQRRYDANGNVVETRRYANPMTGTTVVDGVTRVTVAADNARDQVTRTVYDKANRATHSVDALGFVTQREYDALGRVTSTTRYATAFLGTLADGQVPTVAPVTQASSNWVTRDATTRNEYDAAGRLVKETDPEGVATRHVYDAVGRRIQTIEAEGTSAQSWTLFGYDHAGRLGKEVRGYKTAEMAVTRYALDGVGNRVRIIEARGVELAETDSEWAQKTRVALGLPQLEAALTSAQQAALYAKYTTLQTFDAQGRVTTVTDPLGGVTRTAYDVFGNAVKVTDPNGNTGYFYFDRLNRAVLHVDPVGSAVETTYNAFGTVDAVTRYFKAVAVAGDAAVHRLSETNRPVVVTAAPTEGVYLLKGSSDQITRIEHDKLNRQTVITDAAGYVERMGYDGLGNKVSYTNKVGGVYRYTHDRNGRVLTETSPEKTRKLGSDGLPVLGADGLPVMVDVVTTFAYDPMGNLKGKTEATGLFEQRRTNFAYDRLGRLIQQNGEPTATFDPVNGTDVTVTPTVLKTYDARGNLIEERNPRGGRTLHYYDALGREVARVSPALALTVYTYDEAGNKIAEKTFANTVEFSNGAVLTATVPVKVLDAAPAAGVTAMYVVADKANDRTVFYSYDAAGRQTGTRIEDMQFAAYDTSVNGNQYRAWTGAIETQVVYDAMGNVVKQVDANGNVTRLYYDALGRKVGQLDALRYLTRWQYDGLGNMTTETRHFYAVNAALPVTDDTTLAELTDPANLTASSSVDRTKVYVYDKLNRVVTEVLRRVAYGTLDAAGAVTNTSADAYTRYVYDGLNNVTRKTQGTSTVVDSTTDWKFDLVGRQVREEKPEFQDFEGALVRPTTDREYDALGNVLREIKRGKDQQSESDDRITRFAYGKNGWMTSQTDAAGAVTEFRHDAAGNVTRKTLKGRRDAEGLTVDDVTWYQYDGLNREVKKTDVATKVVYDVLYNAFGEVVGKRSYTKESSAPWQEFAAFDRAGRVWKTNSGDGITKVHVHDAAGNATLTITSRSDVSGLTLGQVLGRKDTDKHISVFDARNQVVKSFEANMEGRRASAVIQGNTTGHSVYVGSKSAISVGSDATISDVQRSGNQVLAGAVAVGSGQVSVSQNIHKGDYSRPNGTEIFIYDAEINVQVPNTTAWGAGNVTLELLGWYVDVTSGAWVSIPLKTVPSKTASFGEVVVPEIIGAEGGSRQFKLRLGQEMQWDKVVDHITYRLSKNTEQGSVSLGEVTVPTETSVDHWSAPQTWRDGSQLIYDWQTSGGFSTPDVLLFSGQRTDATRLILFYRPRGSSEPYSCLWVPRVHNQKGDPISGRFAQGLAGLPKGELEFDYLVMASDDRVVNRQRGYLVNGEGVLDSGQQNGLLGGDGGPGRGYALKDGWLNIVEQGSSAASLRLRYRNIAGGEWNTVTNASHELHQSSIADNGGPTQGWFALRWDRFAAGASFELDVEALDSANNVVNRARAVFSRAADGTPLISNFIAYDKHPALVRFAESVDTKRVEVRYRSPGSQTYSSPVEVTIRDAEGRFVWDASDIAPDARTDYTFEVLITAYSDANLINNQTRATLQIGPNPVVLAAEADTLPLTLRLAPEQNGARSLAIGYRVHGSSDDYKPLEAQAVGSEFHVSLGSIALPATGAVLYEYVYDALDANGKVLGRNNGTFTLQPTGSSAARLDWVITSVDNPNQIVRTQTYNAFGEVISETDGLGRTTSFARNNAGLLTTQVAPRTQATLSNGFVASVRPTTTTTYDLAGRAIATTDANRNVQTQRWAAGSNLLLAEAHAYGQKQHGYDIFGDKRYTVDEIGNRTDYRYDAMGRLVETAQPERAAGTPGNGGSAPVRAVDRYDYDEAGQRISHTNALGHTEKMAYDSLGRVTKATSFQGVVTEYAYVYRSDILGNAGLQVGGWEKTTKGTAKRTSIERSDVFGRMTWKQDLGGHQFTYSYNASGWLTGQTGTSGQNIAFSYYANGYIESIWDKATGSFTSYEYDKEGNRTFEGYVILKDPLNPSGGVRDYYQYARITYDELNRVKSIVDPKATIEYEYDEAGNRRRVYSVYHDGVNGAKRTQDYWYDYDKLNRFVVTKGALSGARATSADDNTVTVVRGKDGVSVAYDASSRRTEAINGVDGTTERYSYTADGFLVDTSINGALRAHREVDVAGRVGTYTEYDKDGKTVTYHRVTTYNNDHRVLKQVDGDGTTNYYYYTDTTDNAATAQNWGAGELARTENIGSGKDATKVNTYYAYEYWDEAKQFAITNQAYNPTLKGRNSAWKPGYSNLEYDVNGHIKTAIDVAGERSFRYVTDAQGLIMLRDELDHGRVNRVHRYYYANGVRVGDVGNDGPTRTDYAQSLAARGKPQASYKNWKPIASADFDQNYEPVSADYPSVVPYTYKVQSGDTLQSIAQTVWGDRAMWYLIAEANGLSGAETLVEDQRLTIPPKITNIHNNSGTFRVYDPGEAMGNIQPTLPAAPKPPGGGCGALGIIVMIVVAVVASVMTAGAMTAPANAGLQAMWTAGTGAMTGGLSTALVVGGAVGSVASQAVGMAMGTVDHFSWSDVAMGAIGAGVGAAIGTSALGGIGGWQGAALRGAVGSALTQGVSVAAGLQKKFDWRGVAAAAAGSVASYGVASAIADEQLALARASGLPLEAAKQAVQADFAGKLFRDTVSRVAGGGARTLALGEKPNWVSIAAQSFGSAIGDSLTGAVLESERNKEKTFGLVGARAPFGNGVGGLDLRVRGEEAGESLSNDALSQLLDAFGRSDEHRVAYPSFTVAAAEVDEPGVPNAESKRRALENLRRMKNGAFGGSYDEQTGQLSLSGGGGAAPERDLAEDEAFDQALKQGAARQNAAARERIMSGLTAEAMMRQKWEAEDSAPAQQPRMTKIEKVHLLLDVVNTAADGPFALIGAVASGVDAGIYYFYEGKKQEATYSLAGAIPGLGIVGGVRRGARVAGEVGQDVKNFGNTKTPLLQEPQGVVADLLYGARSGEGLPGAQGVVVPYRPTANELLNLSEKHRVEFSTTYTLGAGKNGGGGHITLYSGDAGRVSFGEVSSNTILLDHVHPRGTPNASGYYVNSTTGKEVINWAARDIESGALSFRGDQAALQALIDAGSPQRVSRIVPAASPEGLYQPPFRFSVDSKNLDYSVVGGRVLPHSSRYDMSAGPRGYLP
ncbi:LysM peptidoglycan-binding domain-containing protein [Eleftheria terrae]|uniref:LysM peptidoglycan-binding domain-containing protein n=1 Tax=Eleftheria terrae TaxID=1597781 RepID=UPI00263B647F|nr:LysM peptidoglycan-binding domain-containing protein [Eleftheria terrae]WKB51634.1 LysM peptidoglycan-binding domain-containing protein [Eleftheria terrae]